MTEEWRQIPGYEGFYEASNLGRIRGMERVIQYPDGHITIRREKIKKLTENQDGYLTVKLSKNGKGARVPVHRAVYSAFNGSIEDGYEINHRDFNRKNNAIENLEAITHADNVAYTVTAGRHASATLDYSGEKNPNYGNRKLSERYAVDKAEAKRNQSRPGLQNGRCRSVIAEFPDGHTEKFGYITECAMGLIERGISTASVDSVISAIVTAISKDRTYRKIRFMYVD